MQETQKAAGQVKISTKIKSELLPRIELTENQLKVMRDKYMRDAASAEEWLMGVAENIALGEILHEPSVDESEIFKGVDYIKRKFDTGNGTATMTYYLHQNMKNYGEQNVNFRKFIENLCQIASRHPIASDIVNKTRAKFYRLLSSFEFLPNSPTLMNAGRELQQLSACYVLPVYDSIDGIYDSVKHMAIIHKSGGGTGFSFGRLRESGAQVQTTKGVASGPTTFMQIFDKSTEVVRQGGTRRGANMGILPYSHPNIMDFIHMKEKPGVLDNFNISVTIDKKFMDAVKNDEEYELVSPHSGKVTGRLNARFVFNEMIKGAWKTGDPGMIVIDRINETNSNPTPHIGMIESTNPCGEQPLLPYEPCNLGSINLYKFVDEEKKDMNWEKLGESVYTSTHFLDNVIDVNNYPLPQIELMSKGNRRIGLGVMGWAETLVALGIPYNSEKAYAIGEKVMKFINDNCMAASEELAKRRGAFPNYKNSIFDKDGNNFRGQYARPRHSARTTIAPTGTIGITAGLQGAGIEPFFAIVYTRYNAAAIDKIAKGEKPEEKDVFYEVNGQFREFAKKYRFFGLGEKELWQKIDENHKSVIGIKEIPEEVQRLFPTSHDIDPLEHVKMQVAFQKYTDNAVSKTVNLRNEATEQDIAEVYMRAYEWGAKGITIYRDGSKDYQVLNIREKAAEKKADTEAEQKTRTGDYDKQAFGEMSSYYQVETGYGPLHININYDENGPKRVFANITPAGTEISGMTTAIGILLSKYLELGGSPERILKHLNSVKGDKPYGFGSKRVDSIPHGIAKALRDHLIKTGKLKDLSGQTVLPENPLIKEKAQTTVEQHEGVHCPKCYGKNVGMLSGCSGPTCFDCGYSECS